jgi:hypothetical protein
MTSNTMKVTEAEASARLIILGSVRRGRVQDAQRERAAAAKPQWRANRGVWP